MKQIVHSDDPKNESYCIGHQKSVTYLWFDMQTYAAKWECLWDIELLSLLPIEFYQNKRKLIDGFDSSDVVLSQSPKRFPTPTFIPFPIITLPLPPYQYLSKYYANQLYPPSELSSEIIIHALLYLTFVHIIVKKSWRRRNNNKSFSYDELSFRG